MNDMFFEDVEKAIKKDDVILLMSGANSLESVKLELLEKYTQERPISVIYVSITKPYDLITDQLDDRGVESDKIFFIDCMSKVKNSGNEVRSENCVFIDPRNLTNISIAISEAVKYLPDEHDKLVVFDTLSALSVYNDDKPLEKFGQFLTSKIRNWGIKSVILTLEEEMNDGAVASISQFCDQTIHVERD